MLADGTVLGTIRKVTGYTGFNDTDPEEQEGYYFPFVLEKSGETMSFLKNGSPVKSDITWEANNVFRVSQSDQFTVKVDGVTVVTLNFAWAIFAD